MRYNRKGLIYQVGGLHMYYNRYGRIKFVEGNVHNHGCGYCGATGCSITHDPYYNKNWKSKHKRHNYNNHGHQYKNRKRTKKYHNDDDDDDDD